MSKNKDLLFKIVENMSSIDITNLMVKKLNDLEYMGDIEYSDVNTYSKGKIWEVVRRSVLELYRYILPTVDEEFISKESILHGKEEITFKEDYLNILDARMEKVVKVFESNLKYNPVLKRLNKKGGRNKLESEKSKLVELLPSSMQSYLGERDIVHGMVEGVVGPENIVYNTSTIRNYIYDGAIGSTGEVYNLRANKSTINTGIYLNIINRLLSKSLLSLSVGNYIGSGVFAISDIGNRLAGDSNVKYNIEAIQNGAIPFAEIAMAELLGIKYECESMGTNSARIRNLINNYIDISTKYIMRDDINTCVRLIGTITKGLLVRHRIEVITQIYKGMLGYAWLNALNGKVPKDTWECAQSSLINALIEDKENLLEIIYSGITYKEGLVTLNTNSTLSNIVVSPDKLFECIATRNDIFKIKNGWTRRMMHPKLYALQVLTDRLVYKKAFEVLKSDTRHGTNKDSTMKIIVDKLAGTHKRIQNIDKEANEFRWSKSQLKENKKILRKQSITYRSDLVRLAIEDDKGWLGRDVNCRMLSNIPGIVNSSIWEIIIGRISTGKATYIDSKNLYLEMECNGSILSWWKAQVEHNVRYMYNLDDIRNHGWLGIKIQGDKRIEEEEVIVSYGKDGLVLMVNNEVWPVLAEIAKLGYVIIPEVAYSKYAETMSLRSYMRTEVYTNNPPWHRCMGDLKSNNKVPVDARLGVNLADKLYGKPSTRVGYKEFCNIEDIHIIYNLTTGVCNGDAPSGSNMCLSTSWGGYNISRLKNILMEITSIARDAGRLVTGNICDYIPKDTEIAIVARIINKIGGWRFLISMPINDSMKSRNTFGTSEKLIYKDYTIEKVKLSPFIKRILNKYYFNGSSEGSNYIDYKINPLNSTGGSSMSVSRYSIDVIQRRDILTKISRDIINQKIPSLEFGLYGMFRKGKNRERAKNAWSIYRALRVTTGNIISLDGSDLGIIPNIDAYTLTGIPTKLYEWQRYYITKYGIVEGLYRYVVKKGESCSIGSKVMDTAKRYLAGQIDKSKMGDFLLSTMDNSDKVLIFNEEVISYFHREGKTDTQYKKLKDTLKIRQASKMGQLVSVCDTLLAYSLDVSNLIKWALLRLDSLKPDLDTDNFSSYGVSYPYKVIKRITAILGALLQVADLMVFRDTYTYVAKQLNSLVDIVNNNKGIDCEYEKAILEPVGMFDKDTGVAKYLNVPIEIHDLSLPTGTVNKLTKEDSIEFSVPEDMPVWIPSNEIMSKVEPSVETEEVVESIE